MIIEEYINGEYKNVSQNSIDVYGNLTWPQNHHNIFNWKNVRAVHGNLYIQSTNLENLEGLPSNIYGSIFIQNNNLLKSLKGGPSLVTKNYFLVENKILNNIYHITPKIGGILFIRGNIKHLLGIIEAKNVDYEITKMNSRLNSILVNLAKTKGVNNYYDFIKNFKSFNISLNDISDHFINEYFSDTEKYIYENLL